MIADWVADTHVHLYPAYDLGRLFRAAVHHLRALANAPEDRLALLLTERAGTHRYAELREGVPGIDTTPEPDRLRVAVAGDELVIFPGRQIVTRDRIEVLALCVEDEIPDGGELDAVLQRVRDAGGIPVLPWSPGKWRGERGATVLAAIRRAEPGQLCVGDIFMRPRNAPEPAPFRLARERGLPLLAGTDPLPLPNEEDLVGRYGVHLRGASLRDALAGAEVVGERQHLIGAGIRWAKQARRKAT